MKMQTLIKRHNGVCVYCQHEVDQTAKPPHPRAPSRDHFIPKSRGGGKGTKNTVLACFTCNKIKGSMDPRLILVAWVLTDPESLLQMIEAVVTRIESSKPTSH